MEKTKGGWEKEREKNGEQMGHYSACTTYTCNWGNLIQPQISYIRKVKISFYNVARSPLPVCVHFLLSYLTVKVSLYSTRESSKMTIPDLMHNSSSSIILMSPIPESGNCP